MKYFRTVALFLLTVLLMGTLSSCGFLRFLGSVARNPTETKGTEALQSEPIPPSPNDGSSQSDDLSFTLTQETVDAFSVLVEECKALFLGAAAEEAVLGEMLDRLENSYYHIATQSQIAYILYCVSQNDENASNNYLFASSATSDAYTVYNAMCKEIDASNAPNRAFFFSEWTEEEIAEMRGYSEEVQEYQKANDEILVAYRALSEDAFYDGAPDYYLRMIRNQNAIAKLEGYSSYWDYANAEIYGRDPDSYIASMREYVKTYLVPLMDEVAASFNSVYSTLTVFERSALTALLQSDYVESGKKHINAYLSTFDGEAGEAMQSLFEDKNSVFTDSRDSYAGAFTGFLYEYERPICYFGPGYANTFTVVHEMGHYYAALEKGDMDISIDLAEVHSQGNEWLFISYLSDRLGEDVASALSLYQLYNALSTVIRATMIDDFEERCYEQANDSWTAEQFDGVMESVIDAYGGAEWMEILYLYWRYVTPESPVYYISYAVSMLAALQVYCVAETESYAAGQAAFLSLVRSAAEEKSFHEALSEAELTGPGELQTYLLICQLAKAE